MIQELLLLLRRIQKVERNVIGLSHLGGVARSQLRASDIHLLVFTDSLSHQNAAMASRSAGAHVQILRVVRQVRAFVDLLILRILDRLLLELALSKLQLILGKFQVDEIFSNSHLVRRNGPLQLASHYDQVLVPILSLLVAMRLKLIRGVIRGLLGALVRLLALERQHRRSGGSWRLVLLGLITLGNLQVFVLVLLDFLWLNFQVLLLFLLVLLLLLIGCKFFDYLLDLLLLLLLSLHALLVALLV